MKKEQYKKIKNVNLEAFSKNNFKIKAAAIAVSIVVVGSAVAVEHSLNYVYVPKEYDYINKKVCVYGDSTIDNIANFYYTKTAQEIYSSLDEYKKIIVKNNNKNIINGNIYGTYISVPVIVNKEDSKYVRMQEIKKQIKFIEEKKYWVIVIPSEDDTIFKYALSASYDEKEAIFLAQQIIDKNNIYYGAKEIVGKSIWVINPELGKLKSELKQIYEDITDIYQNNYKLTKKYIII